LGIEVSVGGSRPRVAFTAILRQPPPGGSALPGTRFSPLAGGNGAARWRMPPAPRADAVPALHILPGELVVLFLVRLDEAASALAMRPARFLEGLRAAVDLLGFHGLERDEDRLDELMPWAGSV
jgi:hypothetical protein